MRECVAGRPIAEPALWANLLVAPVQGVVVTPLVVAAAVYVLTHLQP